MISTNFFNKQLTGGNKMYERFEQLLQENNLTAYKVSKLTGVATATLSDWKLGKSTPKTNKLQIIANFFDVSLSWLTGDSDNRNQVLQTDNPILLQYDTLTNTNQTFIDNLVSMLAAPNELNKSDLLFVTTFLSSNNNLREYTITNFELISKYI